MGNVTSQNMPVNKKHFIEVLKSKKCSIRKLGNEYEKIERTEKTIRRCLNIGEMPSDLLDRIAKYIDVHPDYLSGVYNNKADKIEDAYLQSIFRSFTKPERYPYLLKAKKDIGYTTYFENILTMNDISMKLFHTLSPVDRVMFRQELDVAILRVLAKYFTHDSLGYDLSETLSYCEAFAEDFDPFSFFAEIEGIGLSEDELHSCCEDNSISDFEEKMDEKYGNFEKR